MTVPARRKIVFILSAGHSGSTILDKTLGSHPDCFSLGEIANLSYDLKANGLCGCGQPLRDCEFWHQIFEEIRLRSGKNLIENPDSFPINIVHNLTGVPKLVNRFNYLLKLSGLSAGHLPAVYRHAVTNCNLLFQILFEKTNASILVDSHKSLSRVIYLLGHLPAIEAKFVFLIRDGRAVLNSYTKKHYQVHLQDSGFNKTLDLTEEMPTPDEVIRGWRKFNLNMKLFQLLRKKSTYFLRHEDFANNPELELENLCRFVGIDFTPAMLDFRDKVNHMICGNPSRINALSVRKADRSWEDSLEPALLEKFNRRAGWLNRYFGYSF